jgi:hypothetical protein
MKGGHLLRDNSDPNDEITRVCLVALDEVALLKRLVTSMALNIGVDFMPADERAMLHEIMGES